VNNILSKFQKSSLQPFSLQSHVEEIEKCFSKKSIEEIIEALKSSRSEFSQRVTKDLKKAVRFPNIFLGIF
jgi:hypothetical protein